MAEQLGVAVLELDGDLTPLEKKINEAQRSAQTGSQKIGGEFKKGVQKATLPAVAALGAVAFGAKKTIDAASNLGESINAVNVVFGDAAGKVRDFSKIAATEAGLSMRAFNELVTPIGAALINVGMGADDAADASINLAKRAADMASVFNVDVSEAMAAIQAGLRGEADPLERFGVGLSDAAIKAYAVENGMAAAGKELTSQQKVQARLGLLMEQTNRVAGDFKNTSDELANSSRIQAAEQENQQASLGQGLLPVYKAFRGILFGVLGFLGEHTTVTKILVGTIVALASGILVANAALKVHAIVTNVATKAAVRFAAALLLNPIGLIVAGVIALGIALVVAYKKSERFRRVVHAAISFVKRHWDLLLLAVGVLPGLLVIAYRRSETFRAVVKRALDIVRGAIDRARGALERMRDFLSFVRNTARFTFEFFRDKVQLVIDKVRAVIDKLKDMVNFIKSIPGKIKGALGSVGGFFANVAGKVGDGIGRGHGLVGQLSRGPANVSPTLYDELALANAAGLQLTSSYRPGAITSSGNPSLHGMFPAKAIDMAGAYSVMRRVFFALVGRPGIREMFLSPYGYLPGVGVYRTSGTLKADHWDHVHIGSFDRGGLLPPGLTLALNNTGVPERVIAPGQGEGVHFHFPRYQGTRRDLMADMKTAVEEFRRQNGGREPW